VPGETSDAVLELAMRIAREAGYLLLDRFGGPVGGVRSKTSETDMVSDSDRDAEALIVERILAERPGDGILGEERGERPGVSGYRWIVDPLDGTTNYLYGVPQWCVSIAVVDSEGVVAGVVHDACREETFAATRGGGAAMNGEPIAVASCAELSKALVATGFGYDATERAAQGALVARVLPRVRDIRRLGAAALDLAWVACGRFDAYYEGYEAPMNAWDVAAGLLLTREARGSTAILSNGIALATAPGIFEELAGLLLDGAAQR
jgi:myo-inositol-1(or 4)-monophosphatase